MKYKDEQMKNAFEYNYTDIETGIPELDTSNMHNRITKERIINDILAIYDRFCGPLKALHITLTEDELTKIAALVLGDLQERVKQDPIALSDEFIYSLSKSFKVIFYHRIAHFIFHLNRENDTFGVHKYCAFDISEYAAITCSIEIHPQVRIGRNFVIDHGVNTLIGATAEIGDNCTILQNVVLGARKITFNERGKRHPTIGNNVHISGGVRLLGPIKVGNNVTIYPDCIITKDVPDDTMIKLKRVQIATGLKDKS